MQRQTQKSSGGRTCKFEVTTSAFHLRIRLTNAINGMSRGLHSAGLIQLSGFAYTIITVRHANYTQQILGNPQVLGSVDVGHSQVWGGAGVGSSPIGVAFSWT